MSPPECDIRRGGVSGRSSWCSARGLSGHPRATSIGPRAREALLSTGRAEEFLAVAERRSESRPPMKARTIAEYDPVAAGPQADVSREFLDTIEGFTPAADLGGCGQHRIDPILLRAAQEAGGEVHWETHGWCRCVRPVTVST
ncbi:hypothetical protein [Streptomyces yatensis]|nr:hypothetical protein [Streptomyces yatensis]